MIKHFSCILITFILISIVNVIAKDLPYDYYPDDYKKFDSKDWPSLRQNLESVLELKNINSIQASDVNKTAQYTLARLSEIEWGLQQQNNIGEYLHQWIVALLFDKGFASLDNSAYKKIRMWNSHAAFLPERVIDVLLTVNKQEGASCIKHVFPRLYSPESHYCKRLRSEMIELLGEHIEDINVARFVGALQSDDQFRLYETEAAKLQEIIERTQLIIHNNQQKSWEWLWDKYAVKTIDGVLKEKYGWVWYHNISDMRSVYENKLDPNIPLAIALNPDETIAKRYVFLYVSMFILNGQVRSGEAKPTEIQIFKQIKDAFNEIVSAVRKKQPEYRSSYMEKAWESLEQNVSKDNKTGGNLPDGNTLEDHNVSRNRTGTNEKAKDKHASSENNSYDSESKIPPEKEKDKPIEKGGRQSRIVRPESRGKDFSELSTSALVRQLSQSEDKITLRKIAKEIGDRSLNDQLELTSVQKERINNAVAGYLRQNATSADANERVEAKQQIERLWLTVVPVLLDNIDSKDPAVAELAIKSLILMRNEEIVKELIKRASIAKDEHSKAITAFALKKMKEQRKSLIPGRECMDRKESLRLYDRLVAPALAELGEETNTSGAKERHPNKRERSLTDNPQNGEKKDLSTDTTQNIDKDHAQQESTRSYAWGFITPVALIIAGIVLIAVLVSQRTRQ